MHVCPPEGSAVIAPWICLELSTVHKLHTNINPISLFAYYNICMFIAAPRLSSSSSAWAVVRSTPRPSSKAFRTGTPGNKSMATSKVCCLSVVDLFDLFSWRENNRNQQREASSNNPISWSFQGCSSQKTHMRARVLDVDSSLSRELADTRGKQLKGPCN